MDLRGDQIERYIKISKRIGRKSEYQRERINKESSISEDKPIRLGNRLFKNLVNSITGGFIGYSYDYPIEGIILGYMYDNICESSGERLINQVRNAFGAKEIELSETSKDSLKSLINTAVGGIVGYTLSPEQPVIGASFGALVGNFYNGFIKGIEYLIKTINNNTINNSDLFFNRLMQYKRYPLARKAEEYSTFAKHIDEGFVRL